MGVTVYMNCIMNNNRLWIDLLLRYLSGINKRISEGTFTYTIYIYKGYNSVLIVYY